MFGNRQTKIPRVVTQSKTKGKTNVLPFSGNKGKFRITFPRHLSGRWKDNIFHPMILHNSQVI